jgi:hypothetical protein
MKLTQEFNVEQWQWKIILGVYTLAAPMHILVPYMIYEIGKEDEGREKTEKKC